MNGNNRGLLIGLAALVVVILALVFANWAWGNSVTNTGNKKEADIESVYPQAQSSLSTCEVKSQQAVQVATANKDAIDKIISDAVKGRYDIPGSAASGAAQVGGNSFFKAIMIAEAYPNLNKVSSLYQNVLATINGCRDDFAAMQDKLMSYLGSFDRWRNGSWGARHYGKQFPNNNMVARIGGQTTLYGKAAEEQMWKVVLTSTANKEYQSGTLDPSTLNLFPATTTG